MDGQHHQNEDAQEGGIPGEYEPYEKEEYRQEEQQPSSHTLPRSSRKRKRGASLTRESFRPTKHIKINAKKKMNIKLKTTICEHGKNNWCHSSPQNASNHR